MKTKILIVEDDASFRSLLSFILKREQFEVLEASSGEEALELFRSNETTPDVLLLDIILPGINGCELYKRMKLSRPGMPMIVIIISRVDDEDSVADSLCSYADDYITKPFSPVLLIARIKAALRTKNAGVEEEPDVIRIKDVLIDSVMREVCVGNLRVNLRKSEFDVLHLFAKNPNRILSRERIIDEVKGEETFLSGRVVDNYIYWIRKKMRDAGIRIETVAGFGYCLRTK